MTLGLFDTNKGTAGVGMFITERLIDSVVDVVRVNERIMYVKLVIGNIYHRFIVRFPIGLVFPLITLPFQGFNEEYWSSVSTTGWPS